MDQETQEAYIRENILNLPIKRIAKNIGRSQTFVRGFMKRNNLKIPKSILERNRKQSYFEKGHKPFNKGLLQTDYMSEEAIQKTCESRFKSGHEPHNTKHDFYISKRLIKGNPYYWIRLSKGKFMLLHRWLWLEAYGHIPKGFNIQFKDGDSLNTNLENLYMVDKKNQLVINRHGGREMPFDLHTTIKLINTLKIKTNEKQNNRP